MWYGVTGHMQKKKKNLKFAENNLPIYWYKTLVFTSIDNMNVSQVAT